MNGNVEALWRAYHRGLHRFIAARLDDPASVDDVLQDVFVKVHAGLGSLRDSERIEGWLYRITRNAVTDYYRKRREASPLPEDIPAEEPDLGDRARREMAACLVPLIARLPARYREALTLSEIEGRPQREVAASLGLSLPGAKSRVQRGRALLREQVDRCCRFEFDHRGTLTDYEPKDGACGAC